jgi:archaellum biogenesis protein FlaJ (TadC family)
VVNAGSDTASVFQIDFQNPAFIRMIGQPVSTEGNFPVSATIE